VSALLLNPRRWVSTLKFKIVLLAVLTGILSAIGTAALVVRSTQESVKRVVLTAAEEDRERTASLLGSKVALLRDALAATARQVPPGAWRNREVLARYLLDTPALGVMFSSVYGAGSDGQMLARVEAGALSGELPNIGERDYFKRAMSSGQPVISEVLWGKIVKAPVVIFAVPVLDRDKQPIGLLAGSITLRSTALFAEMRKTAQHEALSDLVIDRRGRILAHQDPARLMQPAEQEPGLRETVQQWIASGSPIDPNGVATVLGNHVISLAGIPLTDWINVRVTPADKAFAPLADARAAAWPAAAGAGLVAGILAGALGYVMTRPISRLRARAESLLDEEAGVSKWPSDAGEVGELANAIRHVVEQRERRQTEVQALLQQLEAVLDHADVGIALTRSGRFELVSRQFCRIFRCEKTDAIGQHTRMIYPNDQAFDALVAQARPAFLEHGVLDTELELIRRSGQVFWARMRGRAVVPGDVSQGTIWTIEDVTAAKEQRERLAYTASHDALTGLCNRPAFERLLDAAAAVAASEPFCALFIDLDRFKQVNDTGGHAAGDALLRDIAQILSAQVRKTDVVARLGGDEFAVLLAACPSGQAQTIANKLCAAVLAYELAWEGTRFSVGASVGLVEVGAGFAAATDVLRAADSACYEAKKRGRSRVEVFQRADLPQLTVA
jgi:diguanylate cyclase (GGDEF)-like protein/PAS domain S-box-containing protein